MIRVLSVSHAHLVSDLLRAILNDQPDMLVIGDATNEEQALRQAARLSQSDVVVVNAALPGDGALRLTQALSQAAVSPRVVIAGISDDSLVLRFLEAGAAGCVRSAGALTELVQAIRMVARREVALPPSFTALVMQRVADLAEMCRGLGSQLDRSLSRRTLTKREREILKLMAEGYGNREIAERLTIELGTAKNHVHNILEKLHVRSRKDAVACWSLAVNQL